MTTLDLTRFRAAIFDCDGVVADTEAAWDQANDAFLSRRNIVYLREVHKPLLGGRSPAEGAALLQQLFGFPGDPQELGDERVELVAGFLGSAPAFISNFVEFFESVRGRLRVALATGMDDRLVDAVVGGLRLRELFGDVVVTSSDVATSKPAPDLFLEASARLGVPPEACVVFEDSPLGIEAAHRAGMACVALATTYEPEILRNAEIVAADWLSLVVSQPPRQG